MTELGFGYEAILPISDWGNAKFNLGVEWQGWENVAMANHSFGGVWVSSNGDVLEDAGFWGVVLGADAEF
jgi:hypothetical protein